MGFTPCMGHQHVWKKEERNEGRRPTGEVYFRTNLRRGPSSLVWVIRPFQSHEGESSEKSSHGHLLRARCEERQGQWLPRQESWGTQGKAAAVSSRLIRMGARGAAVLGGAQSSLWSA